MTRFINAVLIAVLAFFLFLVAFWQAAEPQDAQSLSIKDVTARWGRADAQGTEVVMGFTLHNPGSMQAKAGALAYQARVDGQVVGQAVQAAPFGVPPKSDTPVRFTLRLPADFAVSWWRTYSVGGEASGMRINGSLEIREPYRNQSVPFAWTSSWTGHLPQRLSEGSHNCETAPGLCAVAVQATWDNGALRATLRLRNNGPAQVLVHNGTLGVQFAGFRVASGPLEAPLAVPAGSEATAEAVVAFIEPQLQAWWPGHVGRCEASPAAVAVALSVSQEGNATPAPGAAASNANTTTKVPAEVTTVSWDLPASPFETGFICQSGR